MIKVLGFNWNSIFINKNNEIFEIKINTKNMGENGWDSYYGDNIRLIVETIKYNDMPNFRYINYKEINDEDLNKIDILMNYKECSYIELKLFDSYIKYDRDHYEGENGYIDLNFNSFGLNKEYLQSIIFIEDESQSDVSTTWYNNIDDFLYNIFEDVKVYIDDNCTYKEELMLLIENSKEMEESFDLEI